MLPVVFQNHQPLPQNSNGPSPKSNHCGNNLMERKQNFFQLTGTLSFLRVAATTSPNEPAPRSFPISKLAKSAEIYKYISKQ